MIVPTFREWCVWAERLGLGELGLMPDQFWSLTYREFRIKYNAFARSERRAEWLVGRLALLINGPDRYPGKPGNPGQLLGYRGVVIRYPEKPWLKSKSS